MKYSRRCVLASMLLALCPMFLDAQAPDYFRAGVHKRTQSTSFPQILGQQYIIESPEESSNSGVDLLLKGNLGSLYLGLPVDGHVEVLSFGIGIGHRGIGIIATTALAEALPSGYYGDYLLAGTVFPIYLYVTYGLFPKKRMHEPVVYFFAGTNVFETLYSQDFMCLGGGVKWTLWVISPAFETRWRRVWSESGTNYNDRFSVGGRIELGGWWAK